MHERRSCLVGEPEPEHLTEEADRARNVGREEQHVREPCWAHRRRSPAPKSCRSGGSVSFGRFLPPIVVVVVLFMGLFSLSAGNSITNALTLLTLNL